MNFRKKIDRNFYSPNLLGNLLTFKFSRLSFGEVSIVGLSFGARFLELVWRIVGEPVGKGFKHMTNFNYVIV